MKFSTFPNKKGESVKWDVIFNNPCSVSLNSFRTGSVMINRRGTLNPDHPDAGNIIDEDIEVPILAHWIHHEKQGDFLLDAGLDASYILDPRGGLEGTGVDEFQLDEDENVAEYIRENGIELKMVFLSHLHADHAAGVRDLPKNIPYVIGKEEYDYYKPEIHGDFLNGLKELYVIDFSQATQIHPLGPCVDLLGDGSLWAIHTPGHTPGHMSFLINGVKGPVLLTMDAAFIQENLERGISSSDFTWDVEKAQESLEKIIEFLEIYQQVRVGAGHEVLK